MSELRENMIREMKLRRLSENTQKAYIRAIKELWKYFKKSLNKLENNQIQDYLIYLYEGKKLAWSSCNVAMAAIIFFTQTS